MELFIKQVLLKISHIISKQSFYYINSIKYMYGLIYTYINYYYTYLKYIKNNLYNITIKFYGFVTYLLGKMRKKYYNYNSSTHLWSFHAWSLHTDGELVWLNASLYLEYNIPFKVPEPCHLLPPGEEAGARTKVIEFLYKNSIIFI